MKTLTPTELITIGIGNLVAESDLTTMASEPTSENVMMSPDFDSLSNYEDLLIDAMCPDTSSELFQNVVDYAVNVMDN